MMFEPATSKLLRELRDYCDEKAAVFIKLTEATRTKLFDSFVSAHSKRLNELLDSSFPILAPDFDARQSIIRYSIKSDWSYIDVMYLALCLDDRSGEFIEELATTAHTYQFFRMLDDVLDDHFNYKGHYTTYLGELRRRQWAPDKLLGWALLPAIMMLLAGLSKERPFEMADLQTVLRGMLREKQGSAKLTLTGYLNLINEKSVTYGLLAYRPVLVRVPAADRCLIESFLCHSIEVSQMVNDYLDHSDDLALDQPNFWNCFETPCEAGEVFCRRLMQLRSDVDDLPGVFRSYGWVRLGSLARYSLECAESSRRR